MLARRRRENCGQDSIWALQYSSHAGPSRVCPASQEELLSPAVLGNAPAQAGWEPPPLRGTPCRGGCLEKGREG